MKYLIAFLSLILMIPAVPSRAESFNPNYLFSDRDLTDISVPDDYAQKFLEARGAGIAGMRFQDLDGSLKAPGDIINFYGKIYGVNPRYLLALIQKEQSLVTNRNPSTCQIDWATGYGRPDGSTCNDPSGQKFRGFTTQIISSAAFVRFFYDKEESGESRGFGYYAGVGASIDGTWVTPANTATAMLYSYTPHIHGNKLLSGIWADWFTTTYPDGSYLKDSRGDTWLIQGGLKRRFTSISALYSRVDLSRIIQVSDDVLNIYDAGAPIQFAEYSLVRAPSGTVYMLVRDYKRPILSMEVFRTIGFNPEEIIDATEQDLGPYLEGEPITLQSSYPTGALLQDNTTGGVYYVENGVKHPIWSAEIMKINFPGRKISPVSKDLLDKLPSGDPLKFREGELVTSPGSNKAVFVISNGMRRPIFSGEVFESLGYTWSRIIYTTDEAVNVHPLGEVVNISTDTFQITTTKK